MAPHFLSATSHTLRRRDSDSPTIAIAVAVAVGTLVFLFTLYRLVTYLRSKKNAAPLPPVQPLAHIREHQLSAFAGPNAVNSLPRSLRHAGSTASLLGRSSSYHLSDTPDLSEEYMSSLNHSPLRTDFTPPQPRFHGRSASSSSSSLEPPVAGPSSSTLSSTQSSLHTQPIPRHHKRSPSHPTSGLRPYSSMSTLSSVSAQNPRSRLAPHATGSNVQIVLPQPLAPELYPYEGVNLEVEVNGTRRSVFFDDDVGSVRGLSDRWLGVGSSETLKPMDYLPAPPPVRNSHRRSRSNEVQTLAAAHPARRSSNSPSSRLRYDSTPTLPSQHPNSLSHFPNPDPQVHPMPPLPTIYAAYNRLSEPLLDTLPLSDTGFVPPDNAHGTPASNAPPAVPPKSDEQGREAREWPAATANNSHKLRKSRSQSKSRSEQAKSRTSTMEMIPPQSNPSVSSVL